MANPVITALTTDVWTKIATAVTTGLVKVADNTPRVYLATYKDTGEAAPANDTTAVPFQKDGYAILANTVAMDVYIKPVGAAGSVLVML
jgi:hypothetical protein